MSDDTISRVIDAVLFDALISVNHEQNAAWLTAGCSDDVAPRGFWKEETMSNENDFEVNQNGHKWRIRTQTSGHVNISQLAPPYATLQLPPEVVRTIAGTSYLRKRLGEYRGPMPELRPSLAVTVRCDTCEEVMPSYGNIESWLNTHAACRGVSDARYLADKHNWTQERWDSFKRKGNVTPVTQEEGPNTDE